jgi:hypothetical protein
MATLYVAEFQDTAKTMNTGSIQAPQHPPIAEHTLSIGGSSQVSNAFAAHARLIRVNTDAVCHVAIGADPTATTGSMRLAENQTEFFGVKGGHKIAVIQGS